MSNISEALCGRLQTLTSTMFCWRDKKVTEWWVGPLSAELPAKICISNSLTVSLWTRWCPTPTTWPGRWRGSWRTSAGSSGTDARRGSTTWPVPLRTRRQVPGTVGQTQDRTERVTTNVSCRTSSCCDAFSFTSTITGKLWWVNSLSQSFLFLSLPDKNAYFYDLQLELPLEMPANPFRTVK